MEKSNDNIRVNCDDMRSLTHAVKPSTVYVAITYVSKRDRNGNRYRKTILLDITNNKQLELPVYNYTMDEVKDEIPEPYTIAKNVVINTDKSKRSLSKGDFYTII